MPPPSSEAQPQEKEKEKAARKGRAFPHCAAAKPHFSTNLGQEERLFKIRSINTCPKRFSAQAFKLLLRLAATQCGKPMAFRQGPI
jgi:hypothetical protein